MPRSTCARRLAAALLALALHAGAAAAQRHVPDSAQEMLLEFRFAGLPRVPVSALGISDSVYLPLGAIFQQLEIGFAFDTAGPRVSGYYLPDSADYSIDLASGTATVGKRSLRLPARAVLVRPPEVYLLPVVLREVFGLAFEVDPRELTLALNTQKPIPVVEKARRRSLQQLAAPQQDADRQAPLRYGWERRLLGPGLLQYALDAGRQAGSTTVSGDFGAGLEALGGNLEISTRGLTSSTASRGRVFARLQYGLPDRGARPTRLDLGHTLSNGLVSLELNGVRISNEPWQPRALLGRYRVHGRTAPGWQAELYLDGSFAAVAQADSLGRVAFDIPLRYGTTFVRLHYLGPAGQEAEEESRVQIPFTLLPERALEYSAALGRRSDLATPASQLSAALGLTSWLTARAGMDHVGDTQGAVHRAAYGAATLRLPGMTLLTATASPGVVSSLDLGAVAASGANYDFSYAHQADDPVFNPTGFPRDLRLRAFAPLELAGTSWLARLDAERAWQGDRYLETVEVEAALSAPSLRPSLRLRQVRSAAGGFVSVDRTLNPGIILYPGGAITPWHLPEGTLLQAQALIDAATLRTRGWSASISARAQAHGQVRIALSRDAPAAARLELGFFFQGIHFRSTTTGLVGGTGGGSQTLAGSLSYDPLGHRLLASGRDALGQGTVRIRPFVDDNGNGRFDPGESPLRAGMIRLRQAMPSLQEDSGRVTRVEGLAAYVRYTAVVDPGEVENPMWTPAFDSFSFVAQPDVVRTLDVPFLLTGTVDGSVLRQLATGTQPVPGLLVLIEAVDGTSRTSVPTFADGAFYAAGLRPGDYAISIDPRQLQALGLVAQPSSIAVTVLKTGELSAPRSVDFRLQPAAPVETPPPPA